MSKDISIQINGTATAFQAAGKVKTNLSAAGTENWVPEDEVALTDLTITENGTYTASERNVYGFGKVTVKVQKSVTGNGVDGNAYNVSVNGDDELVTVKVPSAIVITHLPDQTTYEDKANLDFTGLVVTAYWGDGTVFTSEAYPDGIIPTQELTFSATKMDRTKRVDGGIDDQGGYIPPRQNVTVTWKRPVDDKELSDGFAVFVRQVLYREERVKLPYKLFYNDGEAIDITGTELRVYNQWGEPFDTEYSPKGIVHLDRPGWHTMDYTQLSSYPGVVPDNMSIFTGWLPGHGYEYSPEIIFKSMRVYPVYEYENWVEWFEENYPDHDWSKETSL